METVWTAKDERGFPSKRRPLAASGSVVGAPTVKHRSVVLSPDDLKLSMPTGLLGADGEVVANHVAEGGNQDLEDAMWLETVEALRSAQKIREHHDCATPTNAPSVVAIIKLQTVQLALRAKANTGVMVTVSGEVAFAS